MIHEEEDAVSLPEDMESLAEPVEMDFENPHEAEPQKEQFVLYFRTEDVDLSEAEGEEITLGLGAFPERTVPIRYWDTDTTELDHNVR